jgi:hypothetical protein
LDWLWWDWKWNRKPWLKDNLESKWIKVESPELPNSSLPDLEEQLTFLETSYWSSIDENTIIIWHSLW